MKKNIVFPVLAALSLSFVAARAEAATTATQVTFSGEGGVQLSAVVYRPTNYAQGSNYPAVVMMHGCSGMWSNRVVGATNSNTTPNLQNAIEKWGWKLAADGIVALAVDSFTPRNPAGVASLDWQNQCSGNTYAGRVDPYTTRVDDVRSAWTYLDAQSEIDSASIGLLGWSHGAQAAMVEAAVTPRDSTTERQGAASQLFAATVLFYPGCGSDLGFGAVSSSYWRPYNDVMMNMGTNDSFHADCDARTDIAVVNYQSTSGSGHEVIFHDYSSADHSFDGFSQSWPAAKCSGASPTGDECAMKAADIDSLTFLESRL